MKDFSELTLGVSDLAEMRKVALQLALTNPDFTIERLALVLSALNDAYEKLKEEENTNGV